MTIVNILRSIFGRSRSSTQTNVACMPPTPTYLDEKLDRIIQMDNDTRKVLASIVSVTSAITDKLSENSLISKVIESSAATEDHVLLVLDETGKILSSNYDVKKILGWTADDLYNKSLFDLIPSRLRLTERDRFLKMVSHAQSKMLESDSEFFTDSEELRILKKDDTEIYALAKIRVQKGSEDTHVFYLISDITERRLLSNGPLSPINSGNTLVEHDWEYETDENDRFTKFIKLDTDSPVLQSINPIGKTRAETGIYDLSPENWNLYEQLIESRKSFKNVAFRLVEGMGPQYSLISGDPVFDDNGVFRGYKGSGKFISYSRPLESDIQLRNSILNSISRASEKLFTKPFINSISEVLNTLSTSSAAFHSVIYRHETMYPDASVTYDTWTHGEQIDKGVLEYDNLKVIDPLDIEYLEKGVAIVKLTENFDNHKKEILTSNGISSIVIIPIVVNEYLWGTIRYYYKNYIPSQLIVDALSMSGNILSAALKKDLTELQLSQTNMMMDHVFNVSSSPTVIHREGKIVHVNTAALNVLEKSRSDVINTNIAGLFDKYDEVTITTLSDNKFKKVSINTTAFNVGGITFKESVINDVSTIYYKDKYITTLMEIVDQIDDFVIILDHQFKIIFVNKSLKMMFHSLTFDTMESFESIVGEADFNLVIKSIRNTHRWSGAVKLKIDDKLEEFDVNVTPMVNGYPVPIYYTITCKSRSKK